MRTIYLLPILLLSSVIFASAQQRPRQFDNFDTSRGVAPAGQATPAQRPTPRPNRHDINNPYAPSPAARLSPPVDRSNKKLVKKTAQATMTVYEGYAQREAPKQLVGPRTVLAAATGRGLKNLSTGNEIVDMYIIESSRRYNIDPLLIYAQMSQESSFKRYAKSHKGASGLMQLMPATARRLGVTDIYDPKQNIEGGVKYMRMLLDMFSGDLNLALAGYNAGEGAVMKYGYQIPPYRETQDYVRRISARYRSISGSRPSTDFQMETATVRLADGRRRLVNR
ncbi:MAG: lytic transglycosylase domain-containing protein [Pyrinomonadaceae bacterium]